MNKYEVMYNIKCQLEQINFSLQHMQMILDRAKRKEDIYNSVHTEEAIKYLNSVKSNLQQQLNKLEQSTENTLTK
ncbi:MAG: hypothetical protein IJ371_00625 [Clostridia bacterium]|nr:hypothetical protein [Clostridia bacterium]